MDTNIKNIQLRYQGYLNTPLLWQHDSLFGLQQLEFQELPTAVFSSKISNKLRLGKLVERFVIEQLANQSNIDILLENTQIQNKKLTLGELDCILTVDQQPVHLEIIYKFYLYDASVGTTELEHWIGPNRRDSLVKKLSKLKNKQLPLLQNPYTAPVLKALKLEAKQIQQCVCFKAQLFVPYNRDPIAFKDINQLCVQGFYIPISKINDLVACKFYIPTKLDWLIDAHTWVDWLSFDEFIAALSPIIEQKSAPLCWLKHPNGALEKFFVVWW